MFQVAWKLLRAEENAYAGYTYVCKYHWLCRSQGREYLSVYIGTHLAHSTGQNVCHQVKQNWKRKGNIVVTIQKFFVYLSPL